MILLELRSPARLWKMELCKRGLLLPEATPARASTAIEPSIYIHFLSLIIAQNRLLTEPVA